MMRLAIVCVLGACGGGGEDAGLEAPDDCAPGELHFVHDLAEPGGAGEGQGAIDIQGFGFINAINDELGTFELGIGGDSDDPHVFIEFETLIFEGATANARGFVRLPQQSVVAGNCETGAFTGRITQSMASGTESYLFTLDELNAEPFCGGTPFSGSFAACFGSPN